MPTRTIVDDYILAAMTRVRHAWAENGTLVLTIPDFPGMVACGADVPGAFRELYRLLEGWVWLSYQRGFDLPKMQTEDGEIDLNTADARALIRYHQPRAAPLPEQDEGFIGGPDEMEDFVDSFDQDKSIAP